MPAAFGFRRPALASGYVDALLGRTPFTHRSGLFLTAPRRTGKSTFLRQDLLPAFAVEGILSIYVDLWADRDTDPATLIINALRSAWSESAGAVSKTVRRSGLRQLKVAGLTIDVDRIGEQGGPTLTDGLRLLSERHAGPVALVVDEAQHALSSDAGVSAMFALKAARDALNQGEEGYEPELLLVFTGSHRDKLAALVHRRDQPFFGASVTDFPLLDRDYVDAYVAWINERLAPGNRFDPDDAFRAFDLLGRRPELLEQVLRDFALGVSNAGELGVTVARSAAELRERLWQQYDSDYGQLTSVQRLVLARVVEEGQVNGKVQYLRADEEMRSVWEAACGLFTPAGR